MTGHFVYNCPAKGGEGASSPRARRSAQERIDEVTRARREAEREADYWRTIAYEAAAQLDALAQTGGQDGGPDPNDYVHGEDDANPGTEPFQSRKLFQAIRGNGGTTRLVMLPNEPHWYTALESNEHVVAEMLAWFDRYVKDAPKR